MTRRQRHDRHTSAAATALHPELPARWALLTDAEAMQRSLSEPPPVSVRHNPLKPGPAPGDAVPWCATGRYLAKRPVFTLDPLLHAGAYYVQEASSMLLEQAYLQARPAPGALTVLDLCAAPGGKSTHLAALLPDRSLLVANEIERSRLHILKENLWKQGRPGVVITHERPSAFAALPGAFDMVLVDAPCSGEGMMRRDPFARVQWSPDLVRQCAATQTGILEHAWTALAPGGTLVYSTCTWAMEEDEDQVRRLIATHGAEPIALDLPETWGVQVGVHGARCYSHRVRGEGFFLAVLRKPGAFAERRSASSAETGTSFPEPSWLLRPEQWCAIEHEDIVHLIDRRHVFFVTRLMQEVRIASPGTPAAVRKGDARRPHPALALSAELRHEAWPVLDLTDTQALAYLRGASLSARVANDTALATVHGLGLGWLQGAGNRWNNQWPKSWRIRLPG